MLLQRSSLVSLPYPATPQIQHPDVYQGYSSTNFLCVLSARPTDIQPVRNYRDHSVRSALVYGSAEQYLSERRSCTARLYAFALYKLPSVPPTRARGKLYVCRFGNHNLFPFVRHHSEEGPCREQRAHYINPHGKINQELA